MAQEEEVNYNRLVQMVQQEKKGGPPVHLVADFHDRVRVFIGKLESSYDQERAKDPTSMKALQLADQLQKVRGLQLELLNIRLRKFLLLAHQSLTGGMVETKSFTPEERDLFEAMVAELCKGRNRIIEGGAAPAAAQGAVPVPAGPLPTPATRAVCEAPLKAGDRPAERPAEREGAERTAAGAGGQPEKALASAAGRAERPAPEPATRKERAPAPPPAATAPVPVPPHEPGQLVVVRMLEDVPDFAFGEKGGYSLKKKDVVALPGELAAVLEAHKKAVPVK